ncbi:MAG: sensor histidine kinase [Nocardioidaceae bacterium]|nr:sensor histidine kinase [Nocardioidaceae bacterium]
MPSLDDVALAHTDLSRDDLHWLHLLISDWQIIADLSFADLVLWLPDSNGQGYWGGAQMRPLTGPTAIVDDLVGAFVPRGRRPLVDVAFDIGRIGREGDPEWRDDVPIRVETIPVLRQDRVVAVVARNTNLLGVRTPSRLELAYLQAASDLTRMISLGRFPFDVERRGWTATPGVGDGFIRTDADGLVTYASPNAQSAYRRLGLQGDVTGRQFASATMDLVPAPSMPTDEALPVTLSGRHPRETELCSPAATVILRVIPLQPADDHEGAVILLRDVTELRSRERELITKDATIREIHHRVKNNLQTVAALLRLQTRRLQAPEARAALEEAVRRVGSIAIVHETLSQTFDEQLQFDDVVDRLSHMVFDYSAGGGQVVTRRTGSFGQLRAEVATPLAMVLTEVLQNAAQHGFAGRSGHVEIRVRREAARLSVTVSDDGRGLPAGFDPLSSGGLGTSIVRTLVESELGGVIQMSAGPTRGTVVDIAIPIEELPEDGPQ